MENKDSDGVELKNLIDNIKGIYESANLIEILSDFERVLDNLDMYAYINWEKGELVEGPISSRHWVTAKFMWPKKLPPDPLFINRMISNGIEVTVGKDILKRSIQVKKYDDFKPGTFFPKLVKHPIWTIEIHIPRYMLQEVQQGYVEMGGEKLDLDDLDTAYDQDLDKNGTTGEETEENFSQ